MEVGNFLSAKRLADEARHNLGRFAHTFVSARLDTLQALDTDLQEFAITWAKSTGRDYLCCSPFGLRWRACAGKARSSTIDDGA